jgi:poly-gamma-glutamate synthesis protein (capsule biosynthesis protein)
MFATAEADRIIADKGYIYPFQHTAYLLRDADWTTVQLDTVVSDMPTKAENRNAYRSSAEHLPYLVKAGVDLVSLANRHSMDEGAEGLQSTLKHLKQVGLAGVGAGKNETDAFAPLIKTINGVHIAFLGFTQAHGKDSRQTAAAERAGVALMSEPDRAIRAVEEAAQKAELVVVLAQWDAEQTQPPKSLPPTVAKRWIDAGADLIVGSQGGILRGFEQYKGKWIAYGLGHYIYAPSSPTSTEESAILSADCNGAGDCDLQLTPLILKDLQPRPLERDAALDLYKRLSELSPGAGLDEQGKIGLRKTP